jgi:hypothetical protein
MSQENWFFDGELNTDSPDHENSSYEAVPVECRQNYTAAPAIMQSFSFSICFALGMEHLVSCGYEEGWTQSRQGPNDVALSLR